MKHETILSFSAPLTDRRHVQVRPSSVLELTYAYYFLMKRLDRDRDSNLPWVRQLRENPPAGLDGLREVWRKREMDYLGYELFILACGLGYATDPTPDRFLEDFPTLPHKILESLEEIRNPKHDDHDDDSMQRLRRHFEVLAEPSAGLEMRSALTALWGFMQPSWEREGYEVSLAAGAQLEKEIEATNDLLAALPPHHFVQFEEAAADLRERQKSGQIMVVPLFFASLGGFHLDVGDVDYLGYGVHSESLFQQQQQELTALAGRLKAFSDPTRLLLLVLISRLTQFPLTVGDLAKQLGVSQPTASGHLKLLREAGLVGVSKKGNRAFYTIEEPAVTQAIRELERALLG
jgi:DNA-binding transcriptional ArsR family regulator